MRKERIDKLLLERGLVENRTRAQALILAGQVLVEEQRIDKPGQMVPSSAEIRVKGEPPRYVSRGGVKLEAALRDFKIDPDGKTCVDVGASTGGFTDCLLQHGAARVWALDVGHNQLAWRLRQDRRVEVIEGLNIRKVDLATFPTQFDIATIDVSFISLTKVLPVVRNLVAEFADCVALVKPQFEVGKGEVGRRGIVTDARKHRSVLLEIAAVAAALNFQPMDTIQSPILGAEGNREFLLHLRRVNHSVSLAASLHQKIEFLTPV